MPVTENDMKQPAKADATEMWPEVTKGESDGACFFSKGKQTLAAVSLNSHQLFRQMMLINAREVAFFYNPEYTQTAKK